MGMDLAHGGHLTHGHPMTLPAKIYNFVTYKMKDPETGEIDYEDMRRVAIEKKPKIIIAGFSAYSRTLDYKKFVEIAKEVGAITMADMAHIAGLIAGGALRNPFEDGFDIITSTTHKTLRGPRGGIILTRESEEIAKKIDKAIFPGIQGGPHMHIIAAKAVAFGEVMTPKFKEYTQQILKNAKAMEAVFHREKVRMIGGGTDNHLILADVFGSLGVTGKEAQTVLDEVGITLNMNSIANDTRKPLDPSGIRFGTPAITTRGFKEAECARVAELLIETLRNKDDASKKETIKSEIKDLAKQFPIPENFV
jgi:glycine hydroxymethyltransferase